MWSQDRNSRLVLACSSSSYTEMSLLCRAALFLQTPVYFPLCVFYSSSDSGDALFGDIGLQLGLEFYLKLGC